MWFECREGRRAGSAENDDDKDRPRGESRSGLGGETLLAELNQAMEGMSSPVGAAEKCCVGRKKRKERGEKRTRRGWFEDRGFALEEDPALFPLLFLDQLRHCGVVNLVFPFSSPPRSTFSPPCTTARPPCFLPTTSNDSDTFRPPLEPAPARISPLTLFRLPLVRGEIQACSPFVLTLVPTTSTNSPAAHLTSPRPR